MTDSAGDKPQVDRRTFNETARNGGPFLKRRWEGYLFPWGQGKLGGDGRMMHGNAGELGELRGRLSMRR